MATRTIPIQVEQDNFITALMMGGLFAGMTWVGAYLLGWGFFNLFMGGQFKAGLLGALHSIIPFRQGLETGFEELTAWAAINKPTIFFTLELAPGILAVLIGAGAFWIFHSTFKNSSQDRHLRGRRILEGHEALAGWLRSEGKDADGLRPHPCLPNIRITRERTHFLGFGGVGSGKTQSIYSLMLAALARGDRALIYDNKGDFTACLPKHPAVILAPWDSRSAVWDVAADVSTLAAAREFAARMIVEPGGASNPMWSNAARQIMVACLVELQTESPKAWGFADLEAKLTRPIEALTESARRHFPEAVKALGDGQQNVTTAGIQINLMSYLSVVFDLARAWPTPPAPGRGLSIRAWLTNDRHPAQTVIIQHSGEFDTLAKAFNGAILGLTSQLINSPLVGESRTRRLWFFLDEFPQLGKVEGIFDLAAVGRSKGVRVVIIVQDVAQLKKIYGGELTDALISMVGTHIVARVSAGETADYICEKLIGKREVERLEISVSGAPGASAASRTTTSREVKKDVMLPSELSGLGPTEIGVRVMWLGVGQDALVTELPFTDMTALRAASKIAAWTQHPIQNPAPEYIENAVLAPIPATPSSAVENSASTQSEHPENDVSVQPEHTENIVLASEKNDIEGDEQGEDPPAPPAPAWSGSWAEFVKHEAVSPADQEPTKIVQFPGSTAADAAEWLKDEALDPVEKVAVETVAEVLPEPMGGLIHAADFVADVLDEAPVPSMTDPIQVIPGDQLEQAAPKKKKIIRRRPQAEAAPEVE